MLAAAFLAGQALLLGRAWLGPLAPDPMVVVGVTLALSQPPRRLLAAAVMLGWVRALVLVEPVGGQVLCAWAALFAVATLARGLRRSGRSSFLFGGMVLAAVWCAGALVVSWASGVTVSAGPELWWGVVLAAPVPWLLLPGGQLVGPAR